MANGDSVLLLVDELFRPWRELLDTTFYLGTVYGVYKITQAIVAAVSGFKTYCLPLFGRSVDLKEKYGPWAVVTGATSILGSAFANELARRGLNVVLISHNEQNMTTLRDQIQTQHHVQAIGLCCTIGSGEKMLASLKETLITLNLDIGLLVNISPIVYVHPQYFSLVPHARLWQLVSRNIAPMTMMSHLVLPAMVEKRRGAIINVSSSFGTAPPTPLLGAYTATMSYITHLSLALHKECSSKGVTVQTLVPWKIAADLSTSTMFTPTASKYADHALSTLGVSHYCCGYWLHGLQNLFYGLWPKHEWVLVSNILNQKARRAGLAKALEQKDPQTFQRLKVYGGSAIPSTAGRLEPMLPAQKHVAPKPSRIISAPCSVSVGVSSIEPSSYDQQESSRSDVMFSSGRSMEVTMGRGGFGYKREYSNIITLPNSPEDHQPSAHDDISATI